MASHLHPIILAQETEQVLAVAVLWQRLRQLFELPVVDEACSPRNFLGACDLQALPVFQRRDELAGLEQAVVRAGVQPGKAASHDLHGERALVQIGLVHGGDFQLAARTGLDAAAMSTTWSS